MRTLVRQEDHVSIAVSFHVAAAQPSAVLHEIYWTGTTSRCNRVAVWIHANNRSGRQTWTHHVIVTANARIEKAFAVQRIQLTDRRISKAGQSYCQRLRAFEINATIHLAN